MYGLVAVIWSGASASEDRQQLPLKPSLFFAGSWKLKSQTEQANQLQPGIQKHNRTKQTHATNHIQKQYIYIWEWWQCVSGRGSTLIRWVAEKVTLVFCSGKFPSSHSPPSSSSSSSSWHLHSASTFAKTTWYVLCKKGNFARKSDWQCTWPGIFYSVRGACQCSFLPEGEGGWWGRRKVKLERLCQRPTIPSVIYE